MSAIKSLKDYAILPRTNIHINKKNQYQFPAFLFTNTHKKIHI